MTETSEEDAKRHAVEQWSRALAQQLQIDESELDIDTILAIAGRAAHTVVRPAAPVTTYLIGYAAGMADAASAADAGDAFREASKTTDEFLNHYSGQQD